MYPIASLHPGVNEYQIGLLVNVPRLGIASPVSDRLKRNDPGVVVKSAELVQST